MQHVGEEMKYKLKRHERFDFSRVETDVWYTLWQWRKNWFGRWGWHPVLDHYSTEWGDASWPIRGDKKWAEKIAKELKLEVPK